MAPVMLDIRTVCVKIPIQLLGIDFLRLGGRHRVLRPYRVYRIAYTRYAVRGTRFEMPLPHGPNDA